mmetsp:Transcript_813/g.3372  ORF Transcript_813/g.3372 Transcript_813/m.3372 type:complete len:281 (+) Transcript_813:317-1159(+)
MAVRLLDVLHRLGFAAGFAGELLRVKRFVRAVCVGKPQVVREDVRARDVQRIRHRVDHVPEPARHEVHRLTVAPQSVEQVFDPGAQLRGVVLHERLDRISRRLHHPQTVLQRVAERHVPAHRRRGHRRDFLALSEIRREFVDALVDAHRAVHVEAERGGLGDQIEDVRGGFSVGRGRHRGRGDVDDDAAASVRAGDALVARFQVAGSDARGRMPSLSDGEHTVGRAETRARSARVWCSRVGSTRSALSGSPPAALSVRVSSPRWRDERLSARRFPRRRGA